MSTELDNERDALIAAAVDNLRDDRDTYELPDGRELRLRVESDDITTIRDFECYGEFSRYDYDYSHDSHEPRPSGFDGNAEKLQVARGYWCWWQPPRGDYAPRNPDGTVARRGDQVFTEVRAQVLDLLECGFVSITELCQGEDAYGRPIVTNVASLGGIDSLDNGYLAVVVSDLVAEVLA